MKIEVTYHKNEIAKILDKDGNTLSENSLTAETTILRNGTYKYTVVDELGNTKEVTAKVEGLKIYAIQNLEELKQFRDEVNAGNNFSGIKVIQTADISMNEGKYTINEETGEITFAEDAEQWEPIGNNVTTNNRFYGDYDGQGHTISGIYIDSETDYQGLFGNCSPSGTIKNLDIDKSKMISTASYVGGIAGSANNLENCSNSAEISGASIVGGIAGCANGNINNCYNIGKITATNYSAGGIVEHANGNISNCYNTGEITSKSSVGGIAERANGNIINCYNTGKITSTKSSAGGICQYIDKETAEIKNCYNIGEIYGGSYNVAGIVAEVFKAKLVTNCYNIGNVTAPYDYVAGIVGKAGSLSTIDKCYNLGNISGRSICAGIVGDGTGMYITNCYNSGDITGNQDYVGGINGAYAYSVSSSYNTGKITAPSEMGGIVGYGDNIQTCYNVGQVEGTSLVGGILGVMMQNKGIKNCYLQNGIVEYAIGGYSASNSGCTLGAREEIIPKIQALDEYKADEYNINNGYPILSWQTNNDKLNLINGEGAFVEDTRGINGSFPILAWQLEK